MSINFPGYFFDLEAAFRGKSDTDGESITAGTVAYVSTPAINDLFRAFPNVATAFWSQTILDASIAAEWSFNHGRRPALQRVSHFICELIWRQQVEGLRDDGELHSAITQMDMADATGLTPVHVNRMIRQLNADGLVRLTEGKFRIIDMYGLRQVAEFDERYLQHLSV